MTSPANGDVVEFFFNEYFAIDDGNGFDSHPCVVFFQIFSEYFSQSATFSGRSLWKGAEPSDVTMEERRFCC